MPYRYATEQLDYSDYASGRVFYNAPGHPVLPIRLMSELFQRCLALRQQMGVTGRVAIYDPCCGSAYHLSTLAFLHYEAIETIIGSDIDNDVLKVAQRNLGLLSHAGLQQRANEIETMRQQYGKPSHQLAAESVQRLQARYQQFAAKHVIRTETFSADATHSTFIQQGLAARRVDLVIADVPYGKRVNWQSTGQEEPLWQLLEALRPTLNTQTIVAIIANKAQKCDHADYQRVGRFQIGKRRIFLLQGK